MMTLKQSIAYARKVFVLIDDDYDDYIATLWVPVTKAVAREIVDRAPDDAKPTTEWRDGDDLYLVPQARQDRIQDDA